MKSEEIVSICRSIYKKVYQWNILALLLVQWSFPISQKMKKKQEIFFLL